MSSGSNLPQPSISHPDPPSRLPADVPPDLESVTTSQPADPRRRRLDAFIPGFHNQPPFPVFLRHNWYDIGTQLLCLIISLLLYALAPPIMPRYFPLYPGVEQSEWGVRHSKPYLAEYINTIMSAIVSFVVPAAVMGAVALWGTRRFEDGNAALIGLGYALSTSTLITSLIKIFIGGLRPHFLTICSPTIPASTPGLGSQHAWYTAAQVCRGPKSKVKEAQMSFPSGHACAAFAGFGFLALWLNAMYKILSDGGHFRDRYGPNVEHRSREAKTGQRVHHWKLVLFVLPWCIAVLMAGSKVRDEWHHPIDVVFGALVGGLFAHVAYRMVYRSVYDWRTNHIPMAEMREEQKDE